MKAEDVKIKFDGKEVEQMGEAKEPKVVSGCEMFFRSGLPSFKGDEFILNNFISDVSSLFSKAVKSLQPRYPIMSKYESKHKGEYAPVRSIALGVDYSTNCFINEPPTLTQIKEGTLAQLEGKIPSIASRFYAEEKKSNHLEHVRFLGMNFKIVRTVTDANHIAETIIYTVVCEIIFQMVKNKNPDTEVSFMDAQIFDYTGEI